MIEDMNNLTLEERQKVYEEVHGVGSDHVEETDDMINQAVSPISNAIAEIIFYSVPVGGTAFRPGRFDALVAPKPAGLCQPKPRRFSPEPRRPALTWS